MENESKVICGICNREFKNFSSLSGHVCQKHPTTEEYYLKFINPEKGKCPGCGSDTKFIGLSVGYNKFCSKKCANNSIESQNKSKDTCMKKYGVDHPNKCVEIRNKTKKTCIERYGCENPIQNIDIQNRAKETCMKKYGVDHQSKTEKFKNKYKKTCIERFGFEHPFKNKEVRDKHKETCVERFGCEYPSQNEDVKNKKKKTSNERYGCENPNQNEDVKNKKKDTYMKIYGVDNPMKSVDVVKKFKLNFQQTAERYPLLTKVEELISGPNGEILGHCKNSKCKNSKENDGYFEISSIQIQKRNQGINTHDTDYFYCCEECKQECPLYGKSGSALNNLTNEDQSYLYTQQEYSTWRNEVFTRQLKDDEQQILNDQNQPINFCEICHSIENLQAHHLQPQKLEPGYALDPINGIILCQKCHSKHGHEKGTECSTGNLANKFCE